MQIGRDRRREVAFDKGTLVCLRFSGLESISFGKFIAPDSEGGGFPKKPSKPHNGQDLFQR
jgi:hypothetical protein